MMLCNADVPKMPKFLTGAGFDADAESTDDGSQYGDFGLDLMSEPEVVCVRDDPPGIHQEGSESFKAAGCMLLSEAQAEGETPDFVMATPEELEDPCDLYKLHTAGIADLIYSHDWKVDGRLENATPIGSVPVTSSDYRNLQHESERPTKRCKTMLQVGERAPVFAGICYGGEVLPGGEDVYKHLTGGEGLDQHHGGEDLLDQRICVQNFLDATGQAGAGVSRDFGLRRERQAPNRMIANTWGGDKACRAAARGPKGAEKFTDGASSARVSDRTDDAQPRKKEMEETFLIQQYLAQGVKLDLCAQTSVINKKIDIFLPSDSGFSRSKFFKTMKGVVQKKLLNHVISIDRIRSNGEGTQASSSNIFGKPLALHITVTENCGISLKEKLVLRCYKEHVERGKGPASSKMPYLVQVNAGGKWKCDHALASLLSDIFTFAGFRVETSDIRARAESCVYSVTNRETFRSVMKNQVVSINIPKLITKLQGAGFADVKPLHVTGGMSFELDEPRCKPQVQKTGTIYMPFCADPRAVRLEILKIILPFADQVLNTPKTTKATKEHAATKVGKGAK